MALSTCTSKALQKYLYLYARISYTIGASREWRLIICRETTLGTVSGAKVAPVILGGLL